MANESAVLMTGNRKHFRTPFWNIVAECHLVKKKHEGWEGTNIYILEFDYASMQKADPPTDVAGPNSTLLGSATPRILPSVAE